MTGLCFLDTETNGLHPGRQVWEVGMIVRDEGVDDVEMSFFVEPGWNWDVSEPIGLGIGRYYERHPLGRYIANLDADEMPEPDGKDYVTTKQAAFLVAQATHGRHIVGAVPNFDTEVLASLFEDEKLVPSWHYHLIDVENLLVGYLAGTGRAVQPPWSSQELAEMVDVTISEEDRHTALGDARWAKQIYDAVMPSG